MVCPRAPLPAPLMRMPAPLWPAVEETAEYAAEVPSVSVQPATPEENAGFVRRFEPLIEEAVKVFPPWKRTRSPGMKSFPLTRSMVFQADAGEVPEFALLPAGLT